MSEDQSQPWCVLKTKTGWDPGSKQTSKESIEENSDMDFEAKEKKFYTIQ